MDDNRSGENPPSAAEIPPQPKSGKPDYRTELTNRINALCEEKDRKKLTASFINQLLVEKGYLEETVQGEEKIKRVTEKGRAVGIREEERQAKYGRNYYALIHTRESQQMIMEELGKYLLQFTPAV